MDDLAFRIPGQGLTSGRAVRKKPVPIHPRKGLYGSLVSLDGDSRMPLSFHHFGLIFMHKLWCQYHNCSRHNFRYPLVIKYDLLENPPGKSTIYTWIFQHLSAHCRHVLCSVWSMRSCSASGQCDIWSSDPRLNRVSKGYTIGGWDYKTHGNPSLDRFYLVPQGSICGLNYLHANVFGFLSKETNMSSTLVHIDIRT